MYCSLKYWQTQTDTAHSEFPVFRKHKGLISSITGPYPDLLNLIHTLTPWSLRSILILFSHLCQGFQSGLFHQILELNFLDIFNFPISSPCPVNLILHLLIQIQDHLCGLAVRVFGYRSRGPGFDSWPYQIFWEVRVWNGVHSVSWGQLRSYLNEKVAAGIWKTRD
jgi:hypothetical protein